VTATKAIQKPKRPKLRTERPWEILKVLCWDQRREQVSVVRTDSSDGDEANAVSDEIEQSELILELPTGEYAHGEEVAQELHMKAAVVIDYHGRIIKGR
jgi:hypothetical protein